MNFRILHRDEWLVAIDKPAGYQVHQPEDKRHRVARNFDCLQLLRKQIGTYLHPIHRLDRATSGVLLFALDPESARKASECFRNRTARKTYFCVTRGWTADDGVIDHPLSGFAAQTRFLTVGRIEVAGPVGKYPTGRYSLVRAEPRTGRMHQIRRHFAHVSHPLIGDTVYGDGSHNRFFREQMDTRALLLKAYSLELTHPATGAPIRIQARWNAPWHELFDRFGVCPIEPRA